METRRGNNYTLKLSYLDRGKKISSQFIFIICFAIEYTVLVIHYTQYIPTALTIQSEQHTKAARDFSASLNEFVSMDAITMFDVTARCRRVNVILLILQICTYVISYLLFRGPPFPQISAVQSRS